MTNANERQVAGTHYQSGYQHWDWSRDVGLSPMFYQISKYVSRNRKKNGIEDLQKALHFAEKEYENITTQKTIVRLQTDNFINSNNLSGLEAAIVKQCAWSAMPNTEHISIIIDILKHLLNPQITQKEQE